MNQQQAHQDYLEATEHLTEEERANLRTFWIVTKREFEQEMNRPADIPILDEYCWTHFGQPNGGGWRCAVCWHEQQEVK